MSKKIIYIFLLLILFLCGCKETKNEVNYEKINNVILHIDEIPFDITISNEEYIKECINLYDSLSDEEKEYITNYDSLIEAKKRIEEIKKEDELISTALTKTKEMLDSMVPSIMEESFKTIELPTSYTYNNLNIRISWISSDREIISITGKVTHDLENVNVTLQANLTLKKETLTFEKTILVKAQKLQDLGDKQVVIGYYNGNYKQLTDVDNETIDILNYSFVQIKEKDNEFYVDVSGVYDIASFKNFHKQQIRVCLALGGWQDDKSAWLPYKNAASTSEGRKQVAISILNILEEYNLDGIDMDWEYPSSSDKTNFTLLIKEIYDTLKAKNKSYIVSIAIPAGTWLDSNYELAKLNDCVDYFNVMSYDLESSSVTSHHSALYASTYASASADTSVNYLISRGVTKRKIVIGAAFYGKLYTGVENINNGLGQSFLTKKAINYTLIYQNYLTRIGNGVEKFYDDVSKSYYLYDKENKEFICYDDIESVKLKYKYAKENNLGGLMYWCYTGDNTNQLMTAIYEEMKSLK